MQILRTHSTPIESNSGGEAQELWFLTILWVILWETIKIKETLKSIKY